MNDNNLPVAVSDDGLEIYNVRELGGRISVSWKHKDSGLRISMVRPHGKGEEDNFHIGMGFAADEKVRLFSEFKGLYPEWGRFCERMDEHWNMPDLSIFCSADLSLGAETGDEDTSVIPMRC